MGLQLPDPDALNRVAARPTEGAASLSLTNPAGPDEAAAGFGNEVANLANQERLHIAGTQALDALNQLSKTRTDLTLGAPSQDTPGGFRNFVGGQVLQKDAQGKTILGSYQDKFAAAQAKLASGLSGDAADMFSQRASEMANQFHADLLQHVMQQTDVYHRDVVNDSITMNQGIAALDPTNPVTAATAAKNIDDAITQYASNPRAPDTTSLRQQAISGLHRNIISQSVEIGKEQYAAQYFDAHRGEMTPQDILNAENTLHLAQQQTTAIDAVTRAVAPYGANSGPMPTLRDVQNAAVANLGDNPDPKLRQATLDEATRQYDTIQQAHKITRENTVQAVQQFIIKTGGKVPLTPGLQNRLTQDAPDYADQVPAFMKAANPDKVVQTNQDAYNQAISHPDELAKMSDTQFLDFQMSNFAPKDRDRIAQLRADAASGKSSDGPNSMNTGAFNTEVDNRLTSIGIEPNPQKTDLKGQQQVATIKHYLSDKIFEQQVQLGRKLQPKEIRDQVDYMFAHSTDIPGLVYGTNTVPTMSMKASDIPSDELAKVKAALGQAGVAQPTDDQVLNTYWKWKNGKR